MQKHRLIWTLVLGAALLLLLPRPAYAYMDPGTTGSIFAMFAPFIALLLAFLGFLIRPFRRFVVSMVAKLRGIPRTESLSSDEPHEEKSEKDTGEGLKD